jgi:tetratricopeptide (TPR) repeat protein
MGSRSLFGSARKEAEELIEKVSALVQSKKFDEAVTLLDESMQKRDDIQLRMIKLQVLMMGGKTAEMKVYAEKLLKELAGKPDVISIITWNLYDVAMRDAAAAEVLVPLAITATEGAIAKLSKEEKGSALDTLAHLLDLKGESAKAIEIEEQALKLASEQDKPFMKQFLEKLKAGETKNK